MFQVLLASRDGFAFKGLTENPLISFHANTLCVFKADVENGATYTWYELDEIRGRRDACVRSLAICDHSLKGYWADKVDHYNDVLKGKV